MQSFCNLKKIAMPTNLNALIRYKQIDKELRNPYLKSTIKTLQEACSNQLAEHRGIYKLVAERTIRDDIRVMRSNALGFNARIVVENSYYSYIDSSYSIFNSKMEDMDIMKEVLYLLIEEKDKIKNAKLTKVMKALSLLTGIDLMEEKEEEIIPLKSSRSINQKLISESKFKENICYSIISDYEQPKYGWKSIFELI